MTLLLSLLAGIAGAGSAGSPPRRHHFLGGLFGVSDFEGGRGMLAIWGIGPLGGFAGLVRRHHARAEQARRLLARRHRLAPARWSSPRIFRLASFALWWVYETRPVLNTSGPAPRLAFEVRLPPGVAAADGVKAELHTEKNKMPAPRVAQCPRAPTTAARSLTGSSGALLPFGMAAAGDPRCRASSTASSSSTCPSSPRRSTEIDPLAEEPTSSPSPALSQPRKSGPDEGFEIRYRVLWME